MIKMGIRLLLMVVATATLFLNGCKKEEMNPDHTDCTDTVRVTVTMVRPDDSSATKTTPVIPVDINQMGFDLLDRMQGHWVGKNKVMAWDWDWFAFDYRAVSNSHVFGIFEGGSMGNLFTSFFVSDYKNTRTIMARNGGVLSGLYRTSYFVLDSVRTSGNEHYYRLVDAIGGTQVMYMELRFVSDSLYFNAYTSRLGEFDMATRHMTFAAKKEIQHLAQTAATATGFPVNAPAWDFSSGFNRNNLYVIPGQDSAKSATFLVQGSNNDVYALAAQSGDPYIISDIPRLGGLQVNMQRNATIQTDNLLLFLSDQPLTDNQGMLQTQNFNSVTTFPSLESGENEFLFTYLHPGDYYVTVVADHNGDQVPGQGDYTHAQIQVTVSPGQQAQVSINNINVLN